jgi:hypothetical protein
MIAIESEPSLASLVTGSLPLHHPDASDPGIHRRILPLLRLLGFPLLLAFSTRHPDPEPLKRGSFTMKRLPTPTLLSTSIVPPCKSTHRFTMTIPKPVPGICLTL